MSIKYKTHDKKQINDHYEKTTLFLLLVLIPAMAIAYDTIEIDGINYELYGGRATVVSGNYSGDVIIPSVIYYRPSVYEVITEYPVTFIQGTAFSDCTDLSSVTIGDCVEGIGSGAFDGCTGLKSITIPGNVSAIGGNAFRGCSGLTSVIIEEGVTQISGEAFRDCTGMTSITIPSSVTKMNGNPFIGCTNLTTMNVEPNNTIYDSRNNCNAIIETSTNTLISGCKCSVIPNTVTNLSYFSFAGCSSLISITIPNSVINISSLAFQDCTGLTMMNIPNSVTEIQTGVFQGCTGLISVTIPNSVTTIGEGAFVFCESLSSITIPNSVTSIGDGAFTSCHRLTSVTIPNSVTYIGKAAFAYCSSLSSVKIPGSVKTIMDNTFVECSSLKTVTIPNSVTCIGKSAFQYSGITKLSLPNSLETIGDCAFLGCSGLSSLSIPNNVTSIGDEAFEECSGLTSIVIPSSVTNIGEYAFHQIPPYNNLTSITSYITDVFETGYDAFYGCEDATLYVPRGTKSQYQSTADWYRISNIVEMCNPYDVNNDGSIDISDVVSLVNFILSSSTTDDSYDVNGDGSVDISDVVALVNAILNGTGTGSDDNSQAYLTCPDDNHPHMIDLGLPSGTKWACCNVGASSPEEYGGYYAWGETEEKDVYDWNTYTYCDGSESTCHDLGNDIAGTQYDVAYVKWGGSWVMPSKEQQDELLNNCTYTWTTKNGINGGEFTGPNGGTIFLPAAGNRWKENLGLADGLGTYWSSTQYPSYSSTAYNLYFGSPSVSLDNPGRVYGFTVRPVVKK